MLFYKFLIIIPKIVFTYINKYQVKQQVSVKKGKKQLCI